VLADLLGSSISGVLLWAFISRSKVLVLEIFLFEGDREREREEGGYAEIFRISFLHAARSSAKASREKNAERENARGARTRMDSFVAFVAIN